MSIYGRKAAVPVQPKRPKAGILKKAAGPSRRKLVEERSKADVARPSVKYAPVPPAPRKSPGSKPSPRAILSQSSMSYSPHPPPAKTKKKPSGRPQNRKNYLNILKLKDELISHHRTDANLDKMRSEVGYAMHIASSLISDLSENEDEEGPQTTSRKGYNNPMFEFYRKEAAAAAAARQRQKAVPRKAGLGRRAGKPNSLPLLMVPVVPPREDSFVQELKRRAGMYTDHHMPGDMDSRDRYRVGKVADWTIASLNDEINATVADCQRTVQMLTKLSADTPSMHSLLPGNVHVENLGSLNHQIHQLNVRNNMHLMNVGSGSMMAGMMTPASQGYRLASYLPEIYNQRLEAPAYGSPTSPIAGVPPAVAQQAAPQSNGGYSMIHTPTAGVSGAGSGEKGGVGWDGSSAGISIAGAVVANVSSPSYAPSIVPSFRQVDPPAVAEGFAKDAQFLVGSGQQAGEASATVAAASVAAITQDDEASVLAEAQKSLAQIERALSQLR